MTESSEAAGDQSPRHGPVRRVIREVTRSSPGLIHPALIPGIGVERTGRSFTTNVRVFAIAGALVVGVIAWAIIARHDRHDR